MARSSDNRSRLTIPPGRSLLEHCGQVLAKGLASRPGIPLRSRWMIRCDMPEVLRIELLSFCEWAWSEEDFIHYLRQRNCIGKVIEDTRTGQVLGFCIYELEKHKLHLLNFAVMPEVRRRGVGREMMADLIRKLSPDRRTRITMELREANLAGHLFLRAMGFRAVGVLRDHYRDWDCDDAAYVFSYRLGRAE